MNENNILSSKLQTEKKTLKISGTVGIFSSHTSSVNANSCICINYCESWRSLEVHLKNKKDLIREYYVSALYYMGLKHQSGMLDNLSYPYNDLSFKVPLAINQIKMIWWRLPLRLDCPHPITFQDALETSAKKDSFGHHYCDQDTIPDYCDSYGVQR